VRLLRDSIARKIEDALKHSRFREGALLADTVVPQTADLRLLLLCAMAYFSSDRFPEFEEFLKRAKRIDDTYPALNEFEAFIKLKSAASRDEAAVAYLSLTDTVPGVRRYGKILKKIRTVHDFNALQKKAWLTDYVRPAKAPVQKRRSAGKIRTISLPRPRLVVAVLILSAAAGVGVWFGIGSGLTLPAQSKTSEPSYIDTVTIENEKYPLLDRVSRERTEYFFYDETEVKTLFDRAKKEMKDGFFNKAIISINTLLLSNANISVKERSAFLKKFIPSPETIPPMSVEPSELFAHRELYEGAVLAFSGKAANVEQHDGKTTFSLLVNFREKPRFDGVVEVYSEKESAISNGDRVDMTGVMLHPSVGGKRPYVQAVRVHKK
jgi:hypothetical protein